jgi:hypothetical protein
MKDVKDKLSKVVQAAQEAAMSGARTVAGSTAGVLKSDTTQQVTMFAVSTVVELFVATGKGALTPVRPVTNALLGKKSKRVGVQVARTVDSLESAIKESLSEKAIGSLNVAANTLDTFANNKDKI